MLIASAAPVPIDGPALVSQIWPLSTMYLESSLCPRSAAMIAVGKSRTTAGAMDAEIQKEQFQRAFVGALAAHAGLNPGQDAVDDDSVDLRLKAKGIAGGAIRNPQIEFQLKCTFRDLVKGDSLAYALGIKNYNDLRAEDILSPRYLAVLVVPRDTAEWLGHSEGCMTLHHECYWMSLRGYPESANATSVTVHIPTKNQLRTATLEDMIKAASRSESL